MVIVRCLETDRKAFKTIHIDPAEIAEDGTDYEGVVVKKPWGYEIERYRDENCSVTWLYLHSKQQTSLHCHRGKTTLLFVVGGEGILITLNGEHALSAGKTAIIERGAFHRAVSLNDSLILYEIESPPCKRDLIRLEDSYGRKGKGYEKPAQDDARISEKHNSL